MSNLNITGELSSNNEAITSLSNAVLLGSGESSLTQTITFSQPLSNFKFIVVGVAVYDRTVGYECYCIPVACATLQTWSAYQDGTNNGFKGSWTISETQLDYTSVAGGRSQGGIVVYGIV